MAGGALVEERSAVVETIESFPTMRSWHWERDGIAGNYSSVEECVGNAATSDALVLLIEDNLTPITRKEYAAAKRAGVETIVLHRTDVVRSAELDRFITREQRHSVTAGYNNISELKSRVFAALRELSVRPVRERIVRARAAREIHTRAYDELDVCVGDDETNLQPLSAVISGYRTLTDEADLEEAFAELFDYIETALDVGLVGVATHLVEDLREIIPPAVIGDHEAWVLNLEGRALSADDSLDAADARFERMRQLGKELDDVDIESTALQNLAISDLLRNELASAQRKCAAAFALKAEIEDWFGSLQVLINHVSVLVAQERFDGALALLDDLESMIPAGQLADQRTTLLGLRSQVLIDQGQLDAGRSLLTRALRSAQRRQATSTQLGLLRNLALLDLERGDPGKSVRWARKAVDLAETLGDRQQEALLRRVLARSLYESNRLREAAVQFATTAEISQSLGDELHHAQSLGNSAACLTDLGRPQQAIELLEATLAAPAPADDTWRAMQLANLAIAHDAAGEPVAAVDALWRASRLATSWQEAAGYLRDAASLALTQQASWHRAPEMLREELELRRTNQSGADWAWEAATMGAMLNHSPQVAHAREFFTAALKVFASNGDRQRAFSVRNDRAIAATEVKDLRAARGDLVRCLAIAQGLHDRALEGQARRNLSEIERQAGNIDAALEYARAGVALAEAAEQPDAEIHARAQLGLAELDRGELDAAEAELTIAIAIATRIGDVEQEATTQAHLASVAYHRGDYERASRLYRRACDLLGDDATVHRAEALSGWVLSDARQGTVRRGAVQELADISQTLDRALPAASTLAEAAQLSVSHRRPAIGAELLALAIALCSSAREDEFVATVPKLLAPAVVAAVETRQRRFPHRLDNALSALFKTDAFHGLADAAWSALSERFDPRTPQPAGHAH